MYAKTRSIGEIQQQKLSKVNVIDTPIRVVCTQYMRKPGFFFDYWLIVSYRPQIYNANIKINIHVGKTRNSVWMRLTSYPASPQKHKNSKEKLKNKKSKQKKRLVAGHLTAVKPF